MENRQEPDAAPPPGAAACHGLISERSWSSEYLINSSVINLQAGRVLLLSGCFSVSPAAEAAEACSGPPENTQRGHVEGVETRKNQSLNW